MFLNIFDIMSSKVGFIIVQSARTKDFLTKKMVLGIVENASWPNVPIAWATSQRP